MGFATGFRIDASESGASAGTIEPTRAVSSGGDSLLVTVHLRDGSAKLCIGSSGRDDSTTTFSIGGAKRSARSAPTSRPIKSKALAGGVDDEASLAADLLSNCAVTVAGWDGESLVEAAARAGRIPAASAGCGRANENSIAVWTRTSAPGDTRIPSREPWPRRLLSATSVYSPAGRAVKR